MQVTLLSHTPDPDRLVAAAARLCYSPQSGATLLDDFSPEQASAFLQQLNSLGHASPFEHANFTFAVDGVSRALSHQLVRHRIASYSQKSQRYVREDGFEYVIPPGIEKNAEQKQAFTQLMATIAEHYAAALAAGIAAEDARYMLPNAATTNLVITMNGRSLHNFFRLRCCTRAQAEIRHLAQLMLAEVRLVAPALFALAGPSCETEGICHEGKMSCGRLGRLAGQRKD